LEKKGFGKESSGDWVVTPAVSGKSNFQTANREWSCLQKNGIQFDPKGSLCQRRSFQILQRILVNSGEL